MNTQVFCAWKAVYTNKCAFSKGGSCVFSHDHLNVRQCILSIDWLSVDVCVFVCLKCSVCLILCVCVCVCCEVCQNNGMSSSSRTEPVVSQSTGLDCVHLWVCVSAWQLENSNALSQIHPCTIYSSCSKAPVSSMSVGSARVCVCVHALACVCERVYISIHQQSLSFFQLRAIQQPRTHTHTFPFFPQASFSLMCSHCLINQWSLSHVLLLYRLCSLFFSTSSQLSSPLYCMQTHTCIHFQSILSLISLDCL